jgi:hypothetical protein
MDQSTRGPEGLGAMFPIGPQRRVSAAPRSPRRRRVLTTADCPRCGRWFQGYTLQGAPLPGPCPVCVGDNIRAGKV